LLGFDPSIVSQVGLFLFGKAASSLSFA